MTSLIKKILQKNSYEIVENNDETISIKKEGINLGNYQIVDSCEAISDLPSNQSYDSFFCGFIYQEQQNNENVRFVLYNKNGTNCYLNDFLVEKFDIEMRKVMEIVNSVLMEDC